jgi:hypothetical protein
MQGLPRKVQVHRAQVHSIHSVPYQSCKFRERCHLRARLAVHVRSVALTLTLILHMALARVALFAIAPTMPSVTAAQARGRQPPEEPRGYKDDGHTRT